ncbi:DUF3592 domain-containing protein [Tengunoibacter tsumagoiensis]|uniref:DUF3592 domain-containing protein n=1 Tax=Tengunoibacter tsumagoiensis TaxID=2014871 RepID=A0A402A0Y7_9CHLR|nr:DUF3592 domain-containing protein [Tengunoibacter tsumagoiensis]GCE12722.1 hypothetical protein KTT_25810 [Tengunoibacter tsumagoiensis]
MMFVVAGLFLLVSGALALATGGQHLYAANFQQGRCTILATRIQPTTVTITSTDPATDETTSETVPGYEPIFKTTLQTQQDKITTEGPDVFLYTPTDATYAQERIKRYSVGELYTCWYFTFDPRQITFMRPPQPNVGEFFFFVPIVITALCGMVCLLVGQSMKKKLRVLL